MIIWATVPRDSLDIPDKALSKEEKGQLHPQCQRELVWEWSLASSSPCRPQLWQGPGLHQHTPNRDPLPFSFL